jgi:uncharacterized protein
VSLTFLQLAQKVIQEQQRPMTVGEIWNIAASKGYDTEVGSKGATPWSTMAAQLYVDVRDNPNSVFVTHQTRPKLFYLKSLGDPASAEAVPVEVELPPTVPASPLYLEKDVHPFLAYHAFFYLHAYVKTINHSKSEKKEYGEWVHPDVVGCYFPFKDWRSEVVEVSALLGETAVKLYSFELKRVVSFGNLRESFFQAVSNSSWANEGYLVAANVDTDEDLRSELRRLSTAFGIGVIELDLEDPDNRRFHLPAQPKETVDWEMVNKLAGMNPDFRTFLERVLKDHRGREVRTELYDRVLGKDDLVGKIARLSRPTVAPKSVSGKRSAK